ncbi:MAG: hypothetical protein IPL28_18905 [Chloroflexi bacterium]|nr:hypothetical protein [Chloroflexota bacterium]
MRSHHLGYRSNPFMTLTTEQWTAVGVWPTAVQPLLAHTGHIQLLGSEGAGKTSSLLLLMAAWRAEGLEPVYEHLPIEDPCLKTKLGGVRLFVLDEAQRLSRVARWRVRRWMRGGGRLVCTSHVDMRRWLGEMATLNVDEGHTAEHWSAVLQAKLAYFALPDVPRATLSAEGVGWLHGRFAPDLRAAEWLLYEVWERLEGVGEVGAADLQRHTTNNQ